MKLVYLYCILTLGEAFFLFIYLVASEKRKSIATILLAVIVFIEMLTLYDEVVLFFKNSNLPVVLYYIGTPLMAAIGPLILGFIHFSPHTNKRIKWHHYLHLFPALLALGFAIKTYHILPYEEKLGYVAYFQQYLIDEASARPTAEVFVNQAFRSYMFAYLVLSWFYLDRNKNRIRSKVSEGFIKFLLLGMMAIAVSTIILEFLPSFRAWQFALFLVIFSSHVFGLAYLYFKPPKKLVQADKYQRSGLTLQEADYIEKKLDCLLNEEKLFRNPLLTLQKLAKEIGTNTHYLSQHINKTHNLTYNDLINQHRVEESKRLLSEEGGPNAMEEVAIASGFASSSSFYRIFKQHVGLTPKQFQQERNS
ncbi:helix-turn-helix domain-containing protein [Muricauda sp. JGD-17]|uniref:Helix-turn-helix domain-containing protein n=1 Tax=Flagellimonas ochracea TaxID=2696472 RepID=A0A964TCV7_9FLAO|nr:helix-turn-helix domain-containing protein [Allomuricauda ochracea]NAY91919.1 helix-turn-helix domain-containing protein [Allomuricauda ochracea]